jgi:broad specificity phosphatase PhoE
MEFKNKYFLLRHGKNIHQAEKKDVVYGYPDDSPPCVLIEEGIKEVEAAGEILKTKNIDAIFCSDIYRTKQTAGIVADIIGFDKNKIIYDERLRDINWGVFAGKDKKDAWAFYNHELLKKFDTPVPGGESWNDCEERMVAVLEDLENNYEGKIILIVSHGDPLWLLECYMRGVSPKNSVVDNEREILTTGEIREI